MSRSPAAGLILAAGASTRFGADKLMFPLGGRPVLQHVIDAASASGLHPLVLVIAGERRGLELRGARPVTNPTPQRGLSSSLRVGLAALSAELGVERVVVLLGDQPLVEVATIRRLLAEATEDGEPILVPRYDDGKPGNPVVLSRLAWPLGGALVGDRGMGQLFDRRPELVRYVEVGGTNPDIDTPADLERISGRS